MFAQAFRQKPRRRPLVFDEKHAHDVERVQEPCGPRPR
jgi:hypothetical protein